MIINKLLRGSSNNLSTYFKDSDGLPIVLSTPVSFSFADFNNEVLVTGTCIQDNVDASKWTATFTVPSGTVVTTDDATTYSLTWTASLPNNTSKEVTRLFEVAEENFVVVNNNLPLLITADSVFSDFLQITKPFTVDSYTVAVRTDISTTNLYVFSEVTSPSIYSYNENYNLYRFQAADNLGNLLDMPNIAGNLQVVWTYVVNGESYTKVNPIFLLNAPGFALIQDLRMSLDRYKFVDIDPNMQWKDYEFLHFAIKGIQRINASNPPSQFDITSLPISLTYAVQQAALVEACRAWYLAEGMRAFEFQGQDVSLNIERTQYIQTVMDQANSWLDNNLSTTKQSVMVTAMMGSRAVATVSLSPTSNFPGMQSRYWPASRLL